MNWKIHTIKIALVSFSILTSFFAIVPKAAHCAEPVEAKKLSGIESVVASGSGSATELTVKLTSPATFTSYKTLAPLRLVIDLSQTTQGNLTSPVLINKGNFKKVTATRFDTDAGVLTRMEIELTSDSEPQITPHPENPGILTISFPSLGDSPASAEVKGSPVARPVTTERSVSSADSAASTAGSEALQRTLTAITVSNNVITLALDGAISDFKTLRLTKPDRYVVDLMNVKSGLSTRLMALNASGVASARIGSYPEKLRIVLDAVNGNFPEATTTKTDSAVIITLDAKAADENANTKLSTTRAEKPAGTDSSTPAKTDAPPVKQAPEKVTAKTSKKAGGAAAIEMIDFQLVDGMSRVSVKVNGDIETDQPVKSAGFVTLTIKNSILPKNLQRSLETRSFVSPVLRVTPLSIKTKKSTDTKIRIATRVTAPFEFRQEGDVLFIDFKHPEGLSGDKLIIEATEPKIKPAAAKRTPTRDEDISASEATPTVDSKGVPTGSTQIFKGRKVTLEFADADVRKIFQLLSEVSGKNFVLGDDVTGNISLKLVNVPWDQALFIILDTKDLDSRESGSVLTIKKKGRFKTAQDEELEIKKTAAKSIELKTETFSVNYATITEIAGQFEKLKTPERIGVSISPDNRTNKIFVKDTPMAIEDMRKLLAQLDVPERQVMIEARIVEATSTFTRSLGVNWGVHYRDGSSSFAGINQLDTSFGGLANAAPTAGASGQPGSSMGISFGKLSSNISLDLRLNAAASAGMIKIISTPKVATLNHKPAKISQGQQIPYQNTTATTGAVTAFVAATLSLEVTPHINANGTIIMKIDAKNDAPGTGSPPPINTKQATTELLLKDGETTVIGGIFVDSEQDGDDGVPYLMDVPLLGKLFRSSSKSKTKTELLIFVTPRILGVI